MPTQKKHPKPKLVSFSRVKRTLFIPPTCKQPPQGVDAVTKGTPSGNPVSDQPFSDPGALRPAPNTQVTPQALKMQNLSLKSLLSEGNGRPFLVQPNRLLCSDSSNQGWGVRHPSKLLLSPCHPVSSTGSRGTHTRKHISQANDHFCTNIWA